MRPAELIAIARELARREPGRPKAESLRRAVSSAYYALFHALALLSADSLVGWRQPSAVFTPIYRSLDHARTRSALEARRKGSRDPLVDRIAVAFASLQDARYHADYDPESFPFSRSSTLELIDSAERAVLAIGSMSADQKLALAVGLTAKSRKTNATQ